MGAVGIVFSLQSIIQAVGFGLSMGCGSLVSLKLGEKKNDEANKYLSSAFFISMACGALIMALCFINLDGLLLLFGSTDTILPYLFELNGVLVAQSVSDILTFLISIPFCIVFIRKNLNREDLEDIP